MINQKNYKLLLLTTCSFIITTTLFQNCSPVKLGRKADQSSSNFAESISYAPKSFSGAQEVTNGNVVLKEYRHKKSNRFFYTSRTQDQLSIERTYAGLFEATVNTITVKASTDAGLSPIYRLFNKGGFHLYTAEINDRTTLLTDSKYQDEGVEGYAIKINSNGTCPTSPSVTYPVYRLSHSGNYKYRLVTDAALKTQFLALGYIDEGVLFCATAVSSTPIAAGTASCNFGSTTLAHGAPAMGYSSATAPCSQQAVTCNNGVLSNPVFHFDSCSASTGSGGLCSWTWADDFAPPRPMNQRPVLRSVACTSANDGQKQNVTDGSADWTCNCAASPPPPPPPSGTASCSFGSSTLAHGATATGYYSTTGTAPCTSQSVTCTNGVLSNPSFNLNSCPAAVVLPPIGSLTPRASTPTSEVLSSPRCNYTTSYTPPSLPFMAGVGRQGSYFTTEGRNANVKHHNLPFIVPVGFSGALHFEWAETPWAQRTFGKVAISRRPDDMTGAGAGAGSINGWITFTPSEPGLYYLVWEPATPGQGEKLFQISPE